MGLHPVPEGHVAAVVTTLEMQKRPAARPMPPSQFRLVRWDAPDPAKYRALFARVGGPWLWYSRLVIDDARLIALTHRPETQVQVVTDRAGVEVGLLELSHTTAALCMIDYFGLIPELTGAGHGRWLMAMAMALAWRPGVECVRVNTCSLDHPSALNFYRAQGFEAVGRTVETFADPRLIGVLDESLAPQVPLLRRR
jgi:GNAT superfamily N-acetyltransferase